MDVLHLRHSYYAWMAEGRKAAIRCKIVVGEFNHSREFKMPTVFDTSAIYFKI